MGESVLLKNRHQGGEAVARSRRRASCEPCRAADRHRTLGGTIRQGVAITPDGSRVYVAIKGSDSVNVTSPRDQHRHRHHRRGVSAAVSR